jgi:hypothetical protein
MGAAIDSKPSSTGTRLLSAYKRAWATVNQTQIQAPGLSTVVVDSPAMILPPVKAVPAGKVWPLMPNLVYRFSGNMIATSANPNVMSIESAGMALILGTQANPLAFGGPLGFTHVNAARLSAQSALLQQSPITFDEWEIDCNDLLTAYPTAQTLILQAYMTLNDTGVAPKQVDTQVNFKATAAQFSNYRFDKWE